MTSNLGDTGNKKKRFVWGNTKGFLILSRNTLAAFRIYHIQNIKKDLREIARRVTEVKSLPELCRHCFLLLSVSITVKQKRSGINSVYKRENWAITRAFSPSQNIPCLSRYIRIYTKSKVPIAGVMCR